MTAKDNIWMRRALAALYGEAEVGHQPIGQKGQKPPIAPGGGPIGAIVPIGGRSEPQLAKEPAPLDTDAQVAFDERAGIAEHDGGLPRTHAEVLAAISTAPMDVDADVRSNVLEAAARFLERAPKR